MHLTPGFRYFFYRLLLFLGLFILASGILGPWIISTKLLYGYYFFIYGNLGKLVIYSAIVFLLLTRDNLPEAKKFTPTRSSFIFLGLATILTIIFFPVAGQLLNTANFFSSWPLSLFTHLLVISIPASLFLFVFPIKEARGLLKIYKNPLLICVAISVIFDLAIFQVWKLWPYLSQAVLVSTKFLFSLTFSNVSNPAPLVLYVNGFGVKILQACSGVDSLFLFSALYILISILDWKKLNHQKLIIMFFPAAIGLFLVNILRVYLIILAGVLISPEITAQLFHTYAGMLLFIAYFSVFWLIFYKRIQK